MVLASLEDSTSSVESSHCSHVPASSWHHWTSKVLSVSRYKMKSHGRYSLQLQMMNYVEHSFMSVGCSCFFWETPAHGFCLFICEIVVTFFLQEFPVSSRVFFFRHFLHNVFWRTDVLHFSMNKVNLFSWSLYFFLHLILEILPYLKVINIFFPYFPLKVFKLCLSFLRILIHLE